MAVSIILGVTIIIISFLTIEVSLRLKKKFKIEISRASFKPEYILNGKTLIVPVAFHLEIKSDEEGIATLEFQYEVFFSVKEVKDFKDVIKDNDILEFFIGYQMDKFVWSYLRCHFSEACVRMGISKVILPMMQ